MPIQWQKPFYWWGPPWTTPNYRSLEDLVASGMLRTAEADWLRDHVRSGGSVLVAARPSGAGKSTLAAALVSEIPDNRRPVYIRGSCETFDWRVAIAEPVTILVNEISDHLPIYAWSAVARQCLELAESGTQLIATAHADSATELQALLCDSAISATVAQVVALDVVVFLHILPTPTGMVRRVESIARWSVDPHSGQPVLRPLFN